nr:NAD(P)-dependent oxidoreductase [Saccharopolyspora sp. HNM0983]
MCGLGNMGGAVAGRLAAHGPLLVFDLDAERVTQVAQAPRITAAAAVPDLAASDIVVLSLPTPKASLQVIADLAPQMRAGGVIVETSTVNPADVVEEQKICAAHGIGIVDAAILSGVSQMAGGSATLLVGGDQSDVDRVSGVLDAISATITRFGPVGSGMAAKVINNAVAHAVMVVLAEAGALAAATGVSGSALAALLSGPEAGLTRPLTHRFVERVLRGDYDGGMPTEAARKDSTLALAMAQDTGVPLFGIHGAHTVYELGVADGLGRLDYASIATLWERWTSRPMTDTSNDEGDDQ